MFYNRIFKAFSKPSNQGGESMTKEEIEKEFMAAFRRYKDLEWPYGWLTGLLYEEYWCLFLRYAAMIFATMSLMEIYQDFYYDKIDTIFWIQDHIGKSLGWGALTLFCFGVTIHSFLKGFVENYESRRDINERLSQFKGIYLDSKRTYKKLYPVVYPTHKKGANI